MPVDLSDLDPFSPNPSSSSSSSSSSRAALFPTAASAPPPAPVPALAPALPVQTTLPSHGVQPGTDPLGFGTLSIGTRSSSPSSSPSASASSSRVSLGAPSTARAVQAQQERSARILRDLDRGPFAPASPPPPLAIPIRRSSRSGSHGSFSPPRRLSTLMDLSAASLSHAPSSPPAETSAFSDPFHAAAATGPDPWRRMRQASFASDRIEQALFDENEGEGVSEGEGEGETSADWGDFQAGAAALHSPLRAEPPAPMPSRPQPVPLRVSSAAHAPPPPRAERAASLPAPAVASSFSSGFSSLFAHPPQTASAYDRRKPSPSPPVRAATSASASGGFDPTAQPIKLVGLRPGVQRVLNEDVAEGIRPALPPRLRLSPRWTLLYSLDQHGISLMTLFSNLEHGLRDRDGGFVLVVKSERGEVFGAYVSEALRDGAKEQRGATRWGGDGSCFLWKSTPFPPTDFRLGSSVQSFKPTFRNTYYVYATSSSSSSSSLLPAAAPGESFLAFGGGEDGVFGLYVDGLFERGWTGTSETYANEPLVDQRLRSADDGGDGGGGAKFEIVGLECWAVGS
ncbi:hypothetical protein JCM3770_001781 [Rhodotorula araucariae]